MAFARPTLFRSDISHKTIAVHVRLLQERKVACFCQPPPGGFLLPDAKITVQINSSLAHFSLYIQPVQECVMEAIISVQLQDCPSSIESQHQRQAEARFERELRKSFPNDEALKPALGAL